MALSRYLRWARMTLIAGLIVVVPLSAAGAVYQTIHVRRESALYRPAGQMVDVGGRRLHLICIGSGEPTVLFEPSGFGGAGSATVARTEIARTLRVCSYDRMGMGFSDPGPGSISVGTLTGDLERLLSAAGVRPPYVIVASSVGGLTAELFARRHPDRVAGMVFVDAGYSGALDRYSHEWSPLLAMEVCAVPVAARLGVLRLLDPMRLRQGKPEDAARDVAALYRVAPMSTFCGMMRGFPQTQEELRAAPPFPATMPLVVLTAASHGDRLIDSLTLPRLRAFAESVSREWGPLQLALAQRSRRGTWRVVPGSTHLIANTHPYAVTSAVFEVLAQAGR